MTVLFWARLHGMILDLVRDRLCQKKTKLKAAAGAGRCDGVAIEANKVGKAAWGAMTEEERERKYKTYRGDCWQHLRNIVIDAMAVKGDQVLREAVVRDLDMFDAYERIEPDGGSMIHATFKHLHHKGEYEHGRGREYKVWRRTDAASACLPGLERSSGNRCASPASKHSRPWILILPQIACSFHVSSSFVLRRFRYS